MRRIALVGAAGLVLVPIAAGLGFLELHSQTGKATPASGCTPTPCAEAGGYRVQVSDVTVQDGIVKMQVTFEVRGRQSMHAEPEDFRLREGGQTLRPITDRASGCPGWPRTSIPDGSSLGPKPLCFRPAHAASPLMMNWNPDLGLTEYFSGGYDIKLRP
ncbi:MAG TPA: hypothetical protein VKF14_07410 [Candidatus Dormibacteraeota bacterium]|nr:hypothetical protein [Candidatus Dormibacteraeota bacterium]